jgi:hypothetical protein
MKPQETHFEGINWFELVHDRTQRWTFVTMGLNTGFTEIGKFQPVEYLTVNTLFDEFLFWSWIHINRVQTVWYWWHFIMSDVWCVTVRDGDTVKHYRIRQLDEGGFFIARRTTFRTLQELVEHYSKDADGLCVNLRKPCVQVSFRIFV